MKTIGLIGGMSWESTVTYYKELNELVAKELGGLHSAKLILSSVDFYDIEKCQTQNDWDKSAKILIDSARMLEKAGADFILICTNTMHKVYQQIQDEVAIPILHIADATIKVLKKNNIQSIGLLGTKYTMQQAFYKQRIIDAGIDVLIPSEPDVAKVNDIIFKELVFGEMSASSKSEYLSIIDKLHDQGAQGVILGCTEIGLLIQQSDTQLPIFDTTLIHARVAVDEVLK